MNKLAKPHFTIKSFVIGIFLDDDKPSFSRISSGIVIAASIFWVTFCLLRNTGKMPDVGGVTAYVSATVAVLYGSNKVATAIESKANGK